MKLIYASSSSVYGANTKTPFSEADRVDSPNSLYAASKKANEAIAHVYHGLYQIPVPTLNPNPNRDANPNPLPDPGTKPPTPTLSSPFTPTHTSAR